MIFRNRSTGRRNIVMKLNKTINRAGLTAGVSELRVYYKYTSYIVVASRKIELFFFFFGNSSATTAGELWQRINILFNKETRVALCNLLNFLQEARFTSYVYINNMLKFIGHKIKIKYVIFNWSRVYYFNAAIFQFIILRSRCMCIIIAGYDLRPICGYV